MPQACVIGLGRSGIAAARVLHRDGWEVTVFDQADSEKLRAMGQTLIQEGISLKLGDRLEPTMTTWPERIVVSPGVTWDMLLLVAARQKGVEVMGELELAWQYLHAVPWLGITGTNGKTTTTSLVHAIFQKAGLRAPACGNIGYAACELVLQNQNYDWIVAEISSYQIESSPTLAPQIGLWTTFTPDHLNRHKTLENYFNIKASLLSRSTIQVLNGDDPHLYGHGPGLYPQAHWISTQGANHLAGLCDPKQGVYLQDNWVNAFGELIAPINLFKMPGQHNQQNLLMAIAAARLAGIDKKAITETLLSFTGVAHRLEPICTVNGVQFINDSKATNYDAAEVGLSSMKGPTILIAGGEAKEGDDQAWLAQIKQKAVAVLLIGDTAPNFAARLKAVGYGNYEIVETMGNAVQRGLELAGTNGATAVLLSPACASFDQYNSFEERGEDFRACCLALV
ncbi:UDP-N-acetylmuramoyl-L-alanine--D-glutamate ligase [Synechocystis sp. PCC 7339]|uniref:UDP-N-acetylmuramoyl-L-alanine--D-glutamate ligase n=1 Tax=unclassified Synechocystis TaxID=2640012 RepID=UPI001BAF9C64|nr:MULTISPECIES: UDP-N-acetylmuramoyl-L-alanine--D-glutamate ligase [unclassified Synechocystis]QUS61738.1 UDP-N-acetylmuramoyl-L-alanine--D-glutamate ligase [Synechocystis sp. PCC 7338]UAJ73936.1 UDP-N-acetylmuramoyl-L-alanine--D-glutamate ligase [Synechocystis sp. PCC 7339]